MRYKLCRCGGVKADCKGGTCNRCGVGAGGLKALTTTQRGYDGRWKRLSQRLRDERPLCEACLERGMVTPTTEVHHKESIEQAPWLRLEPTNLVCLCNECHKAEHANVAP
jgi:hypothetical protein